MATATPLSELPQTVQMLPEILAIRLDRAAEAYEEVARGTPWDSPQVREISRQLLLQAAECREWAQAFRCIEGVALSGDTLLVMRSP